MTYLIILFILVLILGNSKVKGFFGETAVKIYLSRLDKDKYKILNDVLIPNSKGTTSQIDHIIISPYGVFVIETKNYSGWILGSENTYKWTQVIYKRKEKLLNPIIQNKGHVKALQELLIDYPNDIYHPIVTFSTKATLKVAVTSDVVYNTKLMQTIKKYNKEILSMKEVEEIYNLILNANITDRESKKEHVKSIKNNVKTRRMQISNNICPNCGGNLIEKKGKYGKFKGCSNYPKCRFTEKQ